MATQLSSMKEMMRGQANQSAATDGALDQKDALVKAAEVLKEKFSGNDACAKSLEWFLEIEKRDSAKNQNYFSAVLQEPFFLRTSYQYKRSSIGCLKKLFSVPLKHST